MGSYSDQGPFTNGSSPVTAALFTAINNWILTMQDANINAAGSGRLNVKTIGLTTNSISRISIFAAAVVVGNTTVSHGLGTTPDICLLAFNLVSTPVAATIGYDHSGRGATTITVYSSVATNIVGLALKF